jgi:hypothetical protein
MKQFTARCSAGNDSVALASFVRQQKQSSQRPNAAHSAGNRPDHFVSTAVIGDDAAQDGIEQMHQRSGSPHGSGVHFRFDKKQSGKVSDQLIEFHEWLLTLPLNS